MNKFILYRKMQEVTGDASQGGNYAPAPAPAPAPQGAFAKLMAGLGLSHSTTNQQPATPQTDARPATNSQQQAPTQAAPLPSEFFGKLFTPQAPQKDTPTEKTTQVNPWDVSSEALTKNFGNLDVGQFVKQEDMSAALSGDTSAFLNILNTAVKIGAMSAHQASVTTTKQGVELSTKELQQQLPEQMKNFTLENNLGQDPVLSAPHLQPVVKLVKDSILAHYPKATEADIKEGVIAYLQDLGGKFSSQPNNNTQPQSTSSINWDEHFKTL